MKNPITLAREWLKLSTVAKATRPFEAKWWKRINIGAFIQSGLILVNLLWLFGPRTGEHILSNGHVAALFGGFVLGGAIQNIALWLVWRLTLRVSGGKFVADATGLIWRVPLALTVSILLYQITSLVTAVFAFDCFSWFRLSLVDCGQWLAAWFSLFFKWRPHIGEITAGASTLDFGKLVEGYRGVFVLNVVVLLFLTVTGKRTH